MNTIDVYHKPYDALNYYVLDKAKVNVVRSYMYNATFINDLKLLWNSKGDAIVSLRMYPINFLPYYSTAGKVTVGSVVVKDGTEDLEAFKINNTANIVLRLADGKYIKSSSLPTDYQKHSSMIFGGALNIKLYLPFIGMIELNPADVVDMTIEIECSVDINSGRGLYVVYSSYPPYKAARRIIAIREAMIATDISLSRSNANEVANSLLFEGIKAALSASSGNPFLAANTINTVSGIRVNTQVNGNTGGSFSSWYMDIEPYFVLEYPDIIEPDNFDELYGRPSHQAKYLSEIAGYTELSDFHLDNFSTATSEELARLETLLKGGVIF